MRVYSESKLAEVVLAAQANERYQRLGVTSVSLHPGAIVTQMPVKAGELSTPFKAWFTKNVTHTKSLAQGAATSVYCCVAPEIDTLGGHYFANCHDETIGFSLLGVSFPITARRIAADPVASGKYWDSVDLLVKPFLKSVTSSE